RTASRWIRTAVQTGKHQRDAVACGVRKENRATIGGGVRTPVVEREAADRSTGRRACVSGDDGLVVLIGVHRRRRRTQLRKPGAQRRASISGAASALVTGPAEVLDNAVPRVVDPVDFLPAV